MNNEIKEILDKWKCYIELTKKFTTNEYEMLRVENIDKILDYITNLQEKVDQYENPDDMTLMFMWCDEKTKDKIKQLQEENEKLLVELNKNMIERNNYLSKNEKAIEYINKFWKKKSYYEDVDNCMKYATMNEWDKSDLLNILQGEDKE